MSHKIIDRLTPHKGVLNGDDVAYLLDDLKTIPGVTVTEPEKECYLAVLPHDNGVTLSFACFEWVTEDDRDKDVKVFVKLLFTGEGTGSNLREMRHIWWGEDGYLFYMPLSKVIAALGELKKHFDDH